jgi:RimJ/RimL family protein N-acetyltransferase
LKLATRRCRLRRFTLADLGLMRELENDDGVMRFTPMRRALSEEESRERLRKLVAREESWAPLGVWCAETREGSFAGWFMVIPTSFDVPELGFMLPRRVWRQGYAAEIGSELVRVFGSAGLVAVTDADNIGSHRVLEKLGFLRVEERESSWIWRRGSAKT